MVCILHLFCLQAGFKPAEFRFKAHADQWAKIEAVVSMDTECFIANTSSSSTDSRGREEKGADRVKLGLTQAKVSSTDT